MELSRTNFSPPLSTHPTRATRAAFVRVALSLSAFLFLLFVAPGLGSM